MKKHAALPHAEIAVFIAELRGVDGIAARALEFLILTAARTGEVVGATWDEIDLTARAWTIPAERMKASREHRVPLSDRAIEILRALPREAGNNFVFVGVTAGSGMGAIAMYRALKRLRPDATTHGFRATFSTWAHETTAFAAHVIELSLAHNVGNAVERAYRRSDLFEKRAQLMAAWERHCSTPAFDGEVVRIRERVS